MLLRATSQNEVLFQMQPLEGANACVFRFASTVVWSRCVVRVRVNPTPLSLPPPLLQSANLVVRQHKVTFCVPSPPDIEERLP